MKDKKISIVFLLAALFTYSCTCKKVSNPILDNIGKTWQEVSRNDKKIRGSYSQLIFDEKGFYNLKIIGSTVQSDLLTDSMKWYYNNSGEIYLQYSNNYRFGSLSRNRFVFYEGKNKSVFECNDCK